MNKVRKNILKPLLIAVFLGIATPNPLLAANILYLNSSRGPGTGHGGNFRSTIADNLDNYQDGTIFDVDFVQTHVAGDLATFLNAQPIDFYNQIWFDTTILNTTLLNSQDLAALNTWAANNQPEFILDSSFWHRKGSSKVTINEALALRDVGGGIFIGTDSSIFAKTANPILNNFGFDSVFTGYFDMTSNGSFVGDLLLEPETVEPDFFDNMRTLTTSKVPLGTHVLNANGGNRTIEIYENLFSLDSNGNKVSLIGASFEPTPTSVPEPNTIFGMVVALGLGTVLQKKKK